MDEADGYEMERDRLARAIHKRVNSSRIGATVPYSVGDAERAAAAVVLEGWTPPPGYATGETPERPTLERNQAFWNTFHDVNAEAALAQARAQCLGSGHRMESFKRDSGSACSRCGADWKQVAADLRAQGYKVTEQGGRITVELQHVVQERGRFTPPWEERG